MRVVRDGIGDAMSIQKYDIPSQRRAAASRSGSGAPTTRRSWHGTDRLLYIIHQVEDITDFVTQRGTFDAVRRRPGLAHRRHGSRHPPAGPRGRRLGPSPEGSERGADDPLRPLPGARPDQDTVLLQREPRAPHAAGTHPRPGRSVSSTSWSRRPQARATSRPSSATPAPCSAWSTTCSMHRALESGSDRARVQRVRPRSSGTARRQQLRDARSRPVRRLRGAGTAGERCPQSSTRCACSRSF